MLVSRHYGKRAILLIDEYDVPLDKAFQHGYYKEMTALIRGLSDQALKTNDFLQFAALTGCLRVSNELNNFKVLSITDARGLWTRRTGQRKVKSSSRLREKPSKRKSVWS